MLKMLNKVKVANRLFGLGKASAIRHGSFSSLRFVSFVAPVILGAALVAIFFHVGFANTANSLQSGAPSAIFLNPVSPISQGTTSTTSIDTPTTLPISSNITAELNSLVVVTPTNGVLAYESASSSPHEIEPQIEDQSTTTTTEVTTSTLLVTTTTEPIVHPATTSTTTVDSSSPQTTTESTNPKPPDN